MFNIFSTRCFQPFFKEVVSINNFDGGWCAGLVDQLCGLLFKFAKLADYEDQNNEEQPEQNFNEDQEEESSEFKHIEASQRLMSEY